MKTITLQQEIKADSLGWLVSERINKTITIKEIRLPSETNAHEGWTEVRIKLLRGPDISPDALLRAQDITQEVFGTNKIYLDRERVILETDFRIDGIGYCLVFQIKNGTKDGRIYTAQVFYD